VSTGLAQAQMDPGIPHFHTFFTAIRSRNHGANVFYMLTILTHATLNFLYYCGW
jgi:hypothetical protein